MNTNEVRAFEKVKLDLSKANLKIQSLECRLNKISVDRINSNKKYILSEISNTNVNYSDRLGTWRIKSNGFLWIVFLRSGIWSRAGIAGSPPPQEARRIKGTTGQNSLLDLVNDINERGQSKQPRTLLKEADR